MANFTTVQDTTHTCTQNVEFSITKNATYNSASPMTTTGYVQAVIDASAMVAGDIMEVRFYKAVAGGSAGLLHDLVTLSGVQSQRFSWPLDLLNTGWDITVKITTATSRSIGFTVLQDTNDVNALTVAAGAITSIQSGLATSAALATVQADTDDIQTRLPAALVSGKIDANIGALGTGAITATTFAANAITATVIATDAIGAAQVAAGAVTKIQSGLGTGAAQTTLQTSASDIQARLPAALIGGRMNSDVEAWLGTAAAAPTVAGVPKVEISSVIAGAVTTIQAGLALAATALSNVQWTNGRANNLDRLDVASSTLAAASALTTAQADLTTLTGRLTATRAGLLDNLARLDVAVSTLATATALGLVQTDTTALVARLTAIRGGLFDNLTRLDVASSTLATSSALAAVQADTDDLQARTPAALVSGRVPADVGSWLGTAVAATTPGIPNVADIQLRTDYTTARAAHLDVDIGSRAPASTAVSNADLTPGRAAALDRVDVATSTRASASALASVSGDVTTIGALSTGTAAAVISLQADTDNIQTRIPAALDGGGNIKAGVQSLVGGAIATIAVGVLATVIENGIDLAGAIRTILRREVGKLTGVIGGAYVYRDLADTKDAITGTVTTDGRTVVTVDPT